jgi:hypothetical protein
MKTQYDEYNWEEKGWNPDVYMTWEIYSAKKSRKGGMMNPFTGQVSHR